MATDGPVSRWNGITYSGDDERLLHAVLLMPSGAGRFSARSGRRPGAAAPTVSGLTVTMPADGGVIYDESLGGGPWLWALPSPKAVTLDQRPGSGTSRIDLIVARIYNVAGGRRELAIEAVKGDAAASPSKPALPALAMELTAVTVPAGTANLTVESSPTRTVAAGGVLPVATIAARDALPSPHSGLVVYVEATRALSIRNTIGTWDDWTPTADSGWANLTLAAGYESYSPTTHGTAAARLRNGRVQFRGGITKTTGSFPASEVTVIARVPDALRPPVQWEGQVAGSTSNNDSKVSILSASHSPSANAGQLRAHIGSSVPAYLILSTVGYLID